MNDIGRLYANGEGVPQDYAKAREWYEKAAALGSNTASQQIAHLAEAGR
jgi:hypothetical protein